MLPGASDRGPPSHEVQNQEYHCNHYQDMNEPHRNVERQPKDQPQNYEHEEQQQEQ
jgi:hypothetical protein